VSLHVLKTSLKIDTCIQAYTIRMKLDTSD
jgi:hypothetical protein